MQKYSTDNGCLHSDMQTGLFVHVKYTKQREPLTIYRTGMKCILLAHWGGNSAGYDTPRHTFKTGLTATAVTTN